VFIAGEHTDEQRVVGVVRLLLQVVRRIVDVTMQVHIVMIIILAVHHVQKLILITVS